jgi:small subunit ribosomal protein S4
MARYTDARCRLCRRLGEKLYLKGEKCFTKCTLDKRPYPPGPRQTRRRKVSDRGLQWREKQKARAVYGILESQFRKYYEDAVRRPGVTGDTLLRTLELRMDNVVYRLGFADSRQQARQLVRHGHVTVNGRKVNVPSFVVGAGAVVAIKEKSRTNPGVVAAVDSAKGRGVPEWLDLSASEFKGTVKSMPRREDVSLQVNEKLIVELYSK